MSNQVKIMSDLALRGALDLLRRTGAWPSRRRELEAELQRRNTLRRGKDFAP